MPCSNLGFIFIQDRVLVESQSLNPLLKIDAAIEKLSLIILHHFTDNPIYVCECTLHDELLATLIDFGYTLQPVKPFLSQTSDGHQDRLIRAYHGLNWHRQSIYCGQCATPLTLKTTFFEKWCNTCEKTLFPRFSPAVMVLVQKDKQILLARSPHFAPGMYSALAGFIELGESAEQTAHREVKEETGIEIDRLEYFGSQAWPFPDSFMIAFKAHYLQGDIQLDDDEIEDAQWFHLDELPILPSKASIARKLIESVIIDAP